MFIQFILSLFLFNFVVSKTRDTFTYTLKDTNIPHKESYIEALLIIGFLSALFIQIKNIIRQRMNNQASHNLQNTSNYDYYSYSHKERQNHRYYRQQ